MRYLLIFCATLLISCGDGDDFGTTITTGLYTQTVMISRLS